MRPKSANRVFSNVCCQLTDCRTKSKETDLSIRIIDPGRYGIAKQL